MLFITIKQQRRTQMLNIFRKIYVDLKANLTNPYLYTLFFWIVLVICFFKITPYRRKYHGKN